MRTFDENIILLNPNVDASDKEVFTKNGFKTAGKNLVCFLQNGDQADFLQDAYRPARFGELTKDNLGVLHTFGGEVRDPKFKEEGKLKGVLAGMNNSTSQLLNETSKESVHDMTVNHHNQSETPQHNKSGLMNSFNEGGDESFLSNSAY